MNDDADCPSMSAAWAARAADMLGRWEAGETLDIIARRYGVSLDRVRQIIVRHDPDAPGRRKAVRAAETLERSRQARATYKLTHGEIGGCGRVWPGRKSLQSVQFKSGLVLNGRRVVGCIPRISETPERGR